jgi:leucyl-tRNA synthetase
MFMGPLQDTKPWSSQGVQGVHRFLRKIWRVFLEQEGRPSAKLAKCAEEKPQTRRLLHETIKKVTEDIERFRFNTAISQMMIFANHLQKANSISLDTALKFVQILAPFAPHLAEEIWVRLGQNPSISDAPWPEFNPSFLEQKTVRIAFQINGRVRGDSVLPSTASQKEAFSQAKDHSRVATHLQGKNILKVIYVPGKILNIVTD